MDASARLTSKGQVTIPKRVRDALELHEGDEVVFRVESSRAILAKTPDFLAMAGSIAVPEAKRGTRGMRSSREQDAPARRSAAEGVPRHQRPHPPSHGRSPRHGRQGDRRVVRR